jgi:hypothetical protein
MDDGNIALAPAKRARRRWIKWVVAIAVAVPVAALASGYLFIANAYMPLQQIGGGPDTSIPGLFLRTDPDHPSEGQTGTFGPTLVYCSVPSSRFATFMTLTDTGQLPVTILGGDPGPDAPATMDGDGFFLVDFASYRQPLPTDRANWPPTDPLTAPVLPAVTIAQNQTIDVWARYRTLGSAMPSGSSGRRTTVWVRYSVLGVVRTAEMPLYQDVQVEGGCAAR